MENKFFIKSKINVVPPKRTLLFTIVLNIALVLVLVSGVVRIFAEGFRIDTAGYMCIAYLIVSGFKKRPENTEHYEFSVAEVILSAEKVRIRYDQIKQYRGKKYIVEVDTPSVHTLEFSDRLNCLHIGGTIMKYVEDSGKIDNCTDHYLYIEKGMEKEVLRSLEELTKAKIVYMDR